MRNLIEHRVAPHPIDQTPPPWWRQARLWIALIALALLLRTAAMFTTPLEAHEAYYWMYAQHPDWSYFDHPPMVAWVIRFGTFLFGNTEFGVRSIGALMMLAASAALFAHARLWFGRRAALIAAAALAILPVYFGNGFVATMDGPLVFFWTLGLLGISLALVRNQPGWYYLAGAAAGAAMLSKYTGVFIGVGGALALLGHPRGRRHLRTCHPYLACILAIALFTPVIVWNAEHEWASFKFQFLNRFAGRHITLKSPLEFLLFQAAVATPVLLVGAGWIAGRMASRGRRCLTARWWIAVCFSAPLLAVMAYKSLRYPIHINWTLPAFVSLMPAVAKLGLVSARGLRIRRLNGLGLGPILVTGAVCLGIDLTCGGIVLFAPAGSSLTAAFGRWRELAKCVGDYEDRVETQTGKEPLIIGGDSYRTAALLAFYLTRDEAPEPASKFTTSQWVIDGAGLGFEYWSHASDWVGSPGVYVAHAGADLTPVNACFQRTEVVDEPRLRRLGYQLVLCYSYKGPVLTDAARTAALSSSRHPVP